MRKLNEAKPSFDEKKVNSVLNGKVMRASTLILSAALLLCACGNEAYINGESAESDGTAAETAANTETAADIVAAANTGSAEENENAGTDGTDGQSTQDPDQPSETGEESELVKYRSMYENDEISLEELDDKRAKLRRTAALGYESDILDEYLDEYEYNDAVIGHISIDDTVIDAPVLQTIEDYEFYLHRDMDGNESEPGCIILDADSEIGIGSAKTGYLEEYEPSPIQLVHGHNMRNGTMFGSLLQYEDADYGSAHSIIHYDSIYEKRDYELVCAFYSQIYPEDEDVFKYYDIEGVDSYEKSFEWYGNVRKLALYETDAAVAEGDELIVLSTCSYQVENGRFAVVGRRIK